MRTGEEYIDGTAERPDNDAEWDSDWISDRFFDACGTRQSLQIRVHSPDEDEEFVVPERPFVVVGSASNCGIRLEDSSVSFRHAYLQLLGEQILCFDLASRSGTGLGEGNQRQAELAAGSEVRIGPYRLNLDLDDFAEPAVFDDGVDGGEHRGLIDPAEDSPAAWLEFKNAKPRIGDWALRRNVTLIGNSRHCKIRLQDKTVSRVHCSLVRARGAVWAVDLLGKRGIQLNGEQVDFAPLFDNDELTVGRFQIVVHYGEMQNGSRSAIVRKSAPQESGLHLEQATDFESDESKSALMHDPSGASHQLPQRTAASQSAVSRQPLDAALLGQQALAETMIRQFGAMQQQMFEQSQQTMVAVAQMMGAVHRDQMSLLREELERVRKLDEELLEMRRQLLLREGATPVADGDDVGSLDADDSRLDSTEPNPEEVGESIQDASNDATAMEGASDSQPPGDASPAEDSTNSAAPDVAADDAAAVIQQWVTDRAAADVAASEVAATEETGSKVDSAAVEESRRIGAELAAFLQSSSQSGDAKLESRPPDGDQIEQIADLIASARKQEDAHAATDYDWLDFESTPENPVPVAADDAPEAEPATANNASVASDLQTDASQQHLWLNDRLAKVQSERNSRWKKITSLLAGGNDERGREVLDEG